MRQVRDVNQDALNAQWDELAALRFEQLQSGHDITYEYVLKPKFDESLMKMRVDRCLDAGCGTGVFTSHLLKYCEEVHGVDPSRRSIALARKRFGSQIHFHCSTLEKMSDVDSRPKKFDLIVGNMVLMDALDPLRFLHSVRSLLSRRGRYMFTLTHPAFFPIYRGYNKKNWYRYSESMAIEMEFITTRFKATKLKTIHFHRPLEFYFKAIDAAGLFVRQFCELIPDAHVASMYPRAWRYPRYLFIEGSRAV